MIKLKGKKKKKPGIMLKINRILLPRTTSCDGHEVDGHEGDHVHDVSVQEQVQPSSFVEIRC